MTTYYTLLTRTGLAKLAAAASSNTPLRITTLAVGSGDSNSYYEPTDSQTTLRGEQWRGLVHAVGVDAQNPNWITVSAEVPADSGGYSIREVGVFDDSGALIAVGKYPQVDKPLPTSGAVFPLGIDLTFPVLNGGAVSLTVNAQSYATQDFVGTSLAGHSAASDPHPQYLTQARLDAAIGNSVPARIKVAADLFLYTTARGF
jgi:phage-related tail fiber protein